MRRPSPPIPSPLRHAATAALLLLAAPVAAGTLPATGGSSVETASARDDALGAAVRRAVAEEGLEPVWQVGTPFDGVAAAWQAPNRAQGLRTWFLPEGLRVVPWSAEAQPAFRLDVRLAAVRRGTAERALGPVAPTPGDGRVEYRRADLVEWYVNGAGGIEQGFDLATPPLPSASGALELELAVAGDLAVADLDAERWTLIDGDGRRVLSVSGLRAWDATGRPLACRFAARPAGIAIVVEDAGARYPVVVDPTIVAEEARLVPTRPPGGNLGWSIDLYDGFFERAVVGCQTREAAYVLVRSQSGQWVLETKLTPQTGDVAQYGYAVAITDDRIAVGAPGWGPGSPNPGLVFTYRRNEQTGAWQPSGTVAPPPPSVPDARTFGRTVAIDEGLLVVGDPRAEFGFPESGMVRVYRHTFGSWVHEQSLYLSPGVQNAQFGTSLDLAPGRLAIGVPYLGNGEVRTYVLNEQNEFVLEQRFLTSVMQYNGGSVALSGPYLLAGAPWTDDERGMAVLWEKVGADWHERVHLPGTVAGERFGARVALRGLPGGGVRALVSAPESDLQATNSGRVAVYEGNGAGLTQTAALLASDPRSYDRNGSALALGVDFALSGAATRSSVLAFEHDGAGWTHVQRYEGTDHDPGDVFGCAVALRGDFAVVGARLDDGSSYEGGTAHVFERIDGAWQHRWRLEPVSPGVPPLAHYGTAVALNDGAGSVLVGAPNEDGGIGAAYLHHKTFLGLSWTAGQRLEAPDATFDAAFGAAVAMGADVAAVGAPAATGAAAQSGAVYVWRPSFLWTFEQKLVDPAGAPDDAFGRAVAVTADGEILVGAPGADGSAADVGRVLRFAFDGTSWGHVGTLTPVTPLPGEGFGRALAAGGGRLAVGAPLAGTGRALVFDGTGGSWVLQETFAGGLGFGRAVGIDGPLLAVSATDRAWAYAEAPTGWAPVELVPSTGPLASFQVTTPVAASAGAVLVGADGDGSGGPLSGAAFVFRPDAPLGAAFCFGDGVDHACPCGNEGALHEGCAHSGGTGMTIRAAGSTSIAADDLEIVVEQCPPGNAGLVYSGTVALPTPNVIWDGLQCTLGSTLRYRAQFQSDGVFTDTGFVAQDPGGDYFVPGGTYHFQLWTRDAASPSPCGTGANYSPAYGVVMTP